MLSTKVKASAITHLTDARYFAAWETEWLGFFLSPGTAESVSTQLVAALREWVDGVKICGEFGLATAEDILAAVEVLKLRAIQVGMLTPQDVLKELKGKTEILQEIVVESYIPASELTEMMAERSELVDYFILQCTKGGITWDDIQQGIPFNKEQLLDWAQQFPLLLDIQLGDQAPDALLESIPLKGFCVQGGEEEKVGYKSFDELDEFFEALEVLV